MLARAVKYHKHECNIRQEMEMDFPTIYSFNSICMRMRLYLSPSGPWNYAPGRTGHWIHFIYTGHYNLVSPNNFVTFSWSTQLNSPVLYKWMQAKFSWPNTISQTTLASRNTAQKVSLYYINIRTPSPSKQFAAFPSV